MNQPLWKKILSYLLSQHIESTTSEFNEELTVSLTKGRYQLTTGNAIYSFADLYTNFVLAFKHLDIQKRNVENALLLGFGLGSIPIILEKKFNLKSIKYTAVELDEQVIYLAEKYTIPAIVSSVEMINEDAFAYVNNCSKKYDLIAMDIFIDDVVPPDFETIEYLKQIKELLSTNGVLLYNRLSYTAKDKLDTEMFFNHYFKQVFPEGRYFDVDGNWMLVNR